MSFFCWNFRKIFYIFIFPHSYLKMLYHISIFFFKHIRIRTIHRLTSCIILFVFGNLINEKQRKNFDTLVEQFSFSPYMRKDCFSNLNTTKLIFAYLTNNITSIKLNTINKFYRIITSINSGNNKTLFIFFHLSRIIIKVITFWNSTCNLSYPCHTFKIKLDCSCRCGLWKINTF